MLPILCLVPFKEVKTSKQKVLTLYGNDGDACKKKKNQWLHQAVTESQYRANLLKSGSKAESEEVS
jgi:hypothetical protein